MSGSGNSTRAAGSSSGGGGGGATTTAATTTSAIVQCPAGTARPYPPRTWLPPQAGTRRTGKGDNSSAAASFLGIESHNHPRAPTELSHADRTLAREQAVASTFGLFGFVTFVLALALAALFRPRKTEAFLRACDVPPISGGPGRSRAGGFFTILYVFAYTSFFIAFCLRYLYFNEQLTTSLNPSTNEHFLVTMANYRVSIEAVGYAAETCTLPHVIDGERGPCAPNILVRTTGIRTAGQADAESVACVARRANFRAA